jgi:hypothetical protein
VFIVLPFLAIALGSLVIAIMTAVDSSKYPDWAFQQTGSSKFVWQVIPIILIFVCGIAGGVMGLIWYTSKRDQVARAANAGGPPPFYGAPQYQPPGYPPPPAPGWTPPQAPPPAPPASPPPPPPAEPPQ